MLLSVPTMHRHGLRRSVFRPLVPLLGAVTLAAGVGVLVVPDVVRLASQSPAPSITVSDRYRRPLRLLPGREGVRCAPVDPDAASPFLVQAVLAAEDRRFWRHPGVDPLALARAAWQNLTTGRIVSGGSTLTMQLARLLDPRPRTLSAKVVQLLEAVRLEMGLAKKEILAAYLSKVPLGNQLVGFEAAARAYLGKPASQLSPAEAALLAAVPRAPSRTNPWRDLEGLKRRRDRILIRMEEAGFLSRPTREAAESEPVVLSEDPFRTPAPHFLARLLDEVGAIPQDASEVVSTIDPALQGRVETIVARQLGELALQGVSHMAVAVLDVRRGEWLAIEGSGGFWDLPAGQLDGTRAPRQPGSALKPFTYAVAFDRGFTPATVLPDLPRAFTWAGGTWVPRNYDERDHGPLRARHALACSVNVPAAVVLQAVSPAALLTTLRGAGITTLNGTAEMYGLGLTLGAGEVRLDELVAAYAAILNGGEWCMPAAWRAVLGRDGEPLRRPGAVPRRRVCSAEAAAQVVDVLADPEARAPAFGLWSVLRLAFPAAVKTGTSEGFRDNWCIGGTREVVVGVWCGNFDRAAMGNVSGVSGAGAVWREVMLAWAGLAHGDGDLTANDTLLSPPPSLSRVAVCALSGMAPGPSCPATVSELLRRSDAALARCTWHARTADGRSLVHWPPLYRDWASREGLVASESAPAAAPVASASNAAEELVIISPADGDAFVLAPDLPQRFQRLELRCAVPGRPAEVVWLVDGSAVGRVAAPYSARWCLTPGAHRIQVASGGVCSRPVVVTVHGG